MAQPTKTLTRKADSRPARTPAPPTSEWGEARIVIAALLGILGIIIVRLSIFDDDEIATFSTFLAGQLSIAALGASIIIKSLIGGGLGVAAGLFFGGEIPKQHRAQANVIARGVALFAITLVVFIPAMSAGFIWDDDQEITANPSLLTWHGLGEIWAGTKSADYFPLKTTMLWLEYHIWGYDPHGYHIMNIIIHAIDVVILWRLLLRMQIPGAWFASLLFAVHPVHVESVAWIAERKNTLSLFFYLLCIRSYLKYYDAEKRNDYIWALVFCLASLLCKTSVVILPPVLLICIWWMRKKLTLEDVKRSIPFFVVCIVLGLVTIYFQDARAIGQERTPIGGMVARLAWAGPAVWWYVYKAILPINLITIYPKWPIETWYPSLFLGDVAVVAVLAVLGLSYKKIGIAPFLVFAYFVGTLFPVMGLMKMSYMRLTLVADHFQYLSDISFLAAAGAITYTVWQRANSTLKPVVVGACTLLVLSFSAYSWERAGVHQSEETLWAACLKMNNTSESSWQAHNHYGAVLYMKHRVPEAYEHFAKAVELKPENPEVHNNLGLAYAAFGKMDKAIEQYRRAVQIKGDVPAMRRNLADALSNTKQFAEAAKEYQKTIEQDPNDPASHLNYGYVLTQLHRLPEAEQEFEKAHQLNPADPHATQNLEAVRHLLETGGK